MIDATVVRLTQTCTPGRGIRAQHNLAAARLEAVTLPFIVFQISFPQEPAFTRTVQPFLRFGLHLRLYVPLGYLPQPSEFTETGHQ